MQGCPACGVWGLFIVVPTCTSRRASSDPHCYGSHAAECVLFFAGAEVVEVACGIAPMMAGEHVENVATGTGPGTQ